VVRRANTGEDLKSSATISDSTSAISARLVTSEGCPNPDMEVRDFICFMESFADSLV